MSTKQRHLTHANAVKSWHYNASKKVVKNVALEIAQGTGGRYGAIDRVGNDFFSFQFKIR